MITAEMKVADVLREHPEVFAVLRDAGCPDMRNGLSYWMSQLVSLRMAARIHRIPIDELVRKLNAAVAASSKE